MLIRWRSLTKLFVQSCSFRTIPTVGNRRSVSRQRSLSSNSDGVRDASSLRSSRGLPHPTHDKTRKYTCVCLLTHCLVRFCVCYRMADDDFKCSRITPQKLCRTTYPLTRSHTCTHNLPNVISFEHPKMTSDGRADLLFLLLLFPWCFFLSVVIQSAGIAGAVWWIDLLLL